jgi:transposase
MPKPYSDDLRERVIEAVEAGASRREAAESFNLCPSSAVKWLQRWRDTGSAKAKPTGGSTSPLEKHAEQLLALVAEQPDLSLDEIVAAMRKRRIPGSRTAVWRFFARHDVTFKKRACAPPNNNGRTSPAHAAVGGESSSCLTRPGWCSSTKVCCRARKEFNMN